MSQKLKLTLDSLVCDARPHLDELFLVASQKEEIASTHGLVQSVQEDSSTHRRALKLQLTAVATRIARNPRS
jgi:hypothetical protein